MNGVIVTGMEMPKTCKRCPKRKALHINGECYQMCGLNEDGYLLESWFNTNDIKNNENFKSDNCPLKSVEGLIEKINEMKPFDNDKDKVVWIDAKPVPMVCLSDVIEIIKEYCEVTE